MATPLFIPRMKAIGEMSTQSVCRIFSKLMSDYRFRTLSLPRNSTLIYVEGVRSCYDEGKRVAETLMFDYHRQHGIGEIYALVFLQCALTSSSLM